MGFNSAFKGLIYQHLTIHLKKLVLHNYMNTFNVGFPVKINWSTKSKLCFVDRASRYIHVMKTNSMHYLSSVYFVS